MAHKYVYLFSEGDATMRELLGGKGANLSEMTKIGLPVPQGFTISTEACTKYYEDGRQINDGIMAEIMEYISKMENITGKKFGDKKNDPFAKYPELNALVDHYTTSANQMVLDLTNGGHIEFRTRGNGSDMGRGGTFDLVVIDEAQSYTEAQAASLSPLNSAAPSGSPQTILMGTPPDPSNLSKGFIFANSINEIKENPTKEMSLDEVKEILCPDGSKIKKETGELI